MDGLPKTAEEANSWNQEDWKKWVQAHNGVASSAANAVSVTVSGRSANAVVLRELTISIHERKPPLAGTLVKRGGAGGIHPRRFYIRLDRRPPDAELIIAKPGGDPGDDQTVNFPYQVSESEVEEFALYPITEACLCAWSATLHWDADMGGNQRIAGQSQIDDNGRPFLATPTSNATGLVRIPWLSD
ncbi:hypothetical protein [Actinomadura spongiicola]|uniref:hypothetical protein n=1 Tax=Actinomadura spongiicola TaxID=2303421 RepID=UPI0011C11CF8|nr:hypothetical protein [Actinomadura spongiicola]